MMGFGYGYGNELGNGTTWCIAIIALILIALVVYAFVKQSENNYKNTTKSGKDDAINILYKRLANGDITEEEYKKRKKILDE